MNRRSRSNVALAILFFIFILVNVQCGPVDGSPGPYIRDLTTPKPPNPTNAPIQPEPGYGELTQPVSNPFNIKGLHMTDLYRCNATPVDIFSRDQKIYMIWVEEGGPDSRNDLLIIEIYQDDNFVTNLLTRARGENQCRIMELVVEVPLSEGLYSARIISSSEEIARTSWCIDSCESPPTVNATLTHIPTP
jgi:hypothetical protein